MSPAAPTLRAAARSDVGLVRSSNQDSAFAGVRFLVVADGMGGHAGGDVASSIAVGELSALDEESHGAGDAPEQLRRAVTRAHQALLRQVDVQPELAGMGTTVTALLRTGDRLVLAHLGDSRAYLLHEGTLTQVTRDHTFVQQLVDDGRITAEEAERHPQRNVILRVLGDVQSSSSPDVSVRTAQVGDRWLLCSDGLPRVVSDDTIAETMAELDDPSTCADALVQLALRAGAPDNVTCIVADIVDDVVSANPQVVGAAALHRPRRSAAVTSPAARAAALAHGEHARGGGSESSSPGEGDDDEEADPAPRSRTRPAVVVLVTVLVACLVGGAIAGTTWLRRQYYVGVDDAKVAIFQGVSSSVGPFDLSHVVSREDLPVSDLPPVWRSQVASSIPADDLGDARRIVRSLRQASRAGGGPEPTPSSPTPSPSPTTGSGIPQPTAPTALPSTVPSAIGSAASAGSV